MQSTQDAHIAVIGAEAMAEAAELAPAL
ncbi:hypothetical protein LYZ39_28175 [Achromobacter deleyi]|nr:hypothetical protein LYZ39_28175 [Achromobacter deleyi]